MGGSLGVTIKEPNGKEHRMCRWTNPTPWFVNNMDLVEKKPKHVKEYLTQWKEMVKDWDDSGHKKNMCKLPMTPCYAPFPFLAPMDYGLLVVDMRSNKILSMQGYSSYGKEHTVCLLDAEAKEKTNRFIENGRVLRAERFGQKAFGQKAIDLKGKSMMEIQSLVARAEDMLVYDMAPFVVENFEESKTGAKLFKKRLEKLGFVLSAEEKRLWSKWGKRFDD